MKYSNKFIMLALIGTSFFISPACAGKHELLLSLMDVFATRNTSSIAKKFSTPSQFSSEKKIFTKNTLNAYAYRPLTDISSQQKSSFARHYSTSHDGPFLDPTNDIAFKKLFATEDHKPLLVNFLNSLLRLYGERTIKKVELLPTEQVPHIKAAKRTILDVKCTDQRNFQYIVEMQNRKVPNFIKRSQFYVSNAYASQLGDAVDYLKLKPVILLTIANHTLFPVKNDYISYYKTLDTTTHEHDLEDLAYAFVELPKFKKTEQDLKTTEDQWLYMFKNYDKMKTIPKEIPDEIQEAYKTLEQFSWSSEEKEAYDRARISLADEFDALRDATEEGIAKGKIEEKKSIARTLLSKKYLDEDILEITKLTPQELEQLKSEVREL